MKQPFTENTFCIFLLLNNIFAHLLYVFVFKPNSESVLAKHTFNCLSSWVELHINMKPLFQVHLHVKIFITNILYNGRHTKYDGFSNWVIPLRHSLWLSTRSCVLGEKLCEVLNMWQLRDMLVCVGIPSSREGMEKLLFIFAVSFYECLLLLICGRSISFIHDCTWNKVFAYHTLVYLTTSTMLAFWLWPMRHLFTALLK